MSFGFSTLAVVIVSALVTMVLTAFVRRRALANRLIDYPNERSSHSTPTPRGGGLAVVAVVLMYVVWAGLSGRISASMAIGFAGGGILVAIAGWLDDLKSMPMLPRLAFHFVAAGWTLAWLGGFSAVRLGYATLFLGPLGSVLALIGLVWATNLFNFMDGIDGTAAVEALFVGTAGGLFLFRGGAPGLGELALVIAASMLGFLRWNWAPAKIFLGDVGSGFLGFMLAAIAIAAENGKSVPVLVWSILAAVFIVDATVTLVRRFRKGLWRQPHRTHAYQRAVQAGLTHSQVSLAVAVINLVLSALAGAAIARLVPLPVAVYAAFALAAAIYTVVEYRRPFRSEGAPQQLAD
ncbi:MAG: glycosyltransferase family 4 protein [Gemmatimonadota bacterium]|nr:glycosyltransferase family 4 protein [Gemmatimonadota bacterium]